MEKVTHGSSVPLASQIGRENITPPHTWGEGVIYQTSLMSALIAGVYQGSTSVGTLLQQGDFGLGTFHELDGELVALDGQIYQLRADGSACVAPPHQRVPFAVMTRFTPHQQLAVREPMSRQKLHQEIDALVPSDNLYCAIRIEGCFMQVRTRTVPKQVRPYPPMVDAIKGQPTFTFEGQDGSIVAFRNPTYTQGINVPGYHEHFVTHDRTGGGHVQDYVLQSGQVQIETLSRVVIETPTTTDFLHANLTPEHLHAAIEHAER